MVKCANYIDIHTHRMDSRNYTVSIYNFRLSLNEEFSIPGGQLFSAGIHPWDVEKSDVEENFSTLVTLMERERGASAVGETGLDRAVSADYDLQKRVFKRHLDIAALYCKPVIIHCVRAYSDIASIRKELKQATPWILHGFNGSLQAAGELIKSGCYLSFGRALLSPSVKMRELFSIIPFGSIFLESDESPEGIERIYAAAAGIRSIEVPRLKDILAGNFDRVFIP